MAKQDDFARYTIRIPADLYSAIEKTAEEQNRSLNSEITARLNLSFGYYEAIKKIEFLQNENNKLNREIELMEGDLRQVAEDRKNAEIKNINQSIYVGNFRILLKTICNHILSFGESVPEDLRTFAKDTLSEIKSEETAQPK
ncbi:Arc family DNA-binding protein [Shinella sp. M27]|uniref:Arc family DNA-binding protein n=1 Tax=Shinella sp. M27 TaxID=3368614 RepID=UPI003BA3A9D3